MKTKVILYITPGLPIGGAEKFLVSLSNSLTSETSKQIIITLSDNNPIIPEFDNSIQIIKIQRSKKYSIGILLKLRRIIKEQKPDCIICLNFFSYILTRFTCLNFKNKPKLFISYHSTIHLNKKEHNLHRLYFSTLKKNYSIITVSDNQAKYTSSHYKLPLKRFTTIHNGVDTNFWRLSENNDMRNKIRNFFSIPEQSKVIIIAAGFRPEKNHIGAIKSLQILHRKYSLKAYLLLVGDGPLKDEIKKEANESGLIEYIKFAGLQKDVRPYYWASDLFTLTSFAIETFSIAALEAMSSGLPCVLTNIGGADEMISNNFNGFLCEPDEISLSDTWFKALKKEFKPELIHKYVNEKFSIEKMIVEYKELLQISSSN